MSDTPRQEPWLDGSQTERCADLGPKTLQVWPQPLGPAQEWGAGARRGCRQSWGPSPAAQLPCGSGRRGRVGAETAWGCSTTPPPLWSPCSPQVLPKATAPAPSHLGVSRTPAQGGPTRGCRRMRSRQAERSLHAGSGPGRPRCPHPRLTGDGRRPGGLGPSQQAALSPETLTPARQRAVAMVTTGRRPLRVPVPPATSPRPRSPGAGAEGERSSPAEVPWPTPRARASQPRIQAEAFPHTSGPQDPQPRHRKPTGPASVSAGHPPAACSATPARRDPLPPCWSPRGPRPRCPRGTAALSGGHKRCGAVSPGVCVTQRRSTAIWAPPCPDPTPTHAGRSSEAAKEQAPLPTVADDHVRLLLTALSTQHCKISPMRHSD